MMFPRTCVSALATLALCACSSYSIGEPLTPTSEELLSGSVALAVPLADGSLLVDDGTVLAIVTSGREPSPIGLTGEVGSLRAYAILDGTTLVAGSAGTFVVQTGPGAGLFRAPIEVVIGSEVVHALAVSPRLDQPSDLWVSTDQNLYLFRDARLTPIQVDGSALSNTELATRGAATIWAASADGILELRVESDAVAFTATRISRPDGASSVAVDDTGTLWLVSATGLYSLRSDLRLDQYALPFTPAHLYAGRDASDLWVQADDGSFYHELHRVFRPVVSPLLEGVLAGPEGTLYAHTSTGVARIRARHSLSLEGLHSGPILTATRVEILLPDSDHVTAVRARAGAVELEITGPFDVAATPPSFVLEPGPIPVGAHQLVIEADYDDGTLTASLAVGIDVATDATWTNDIEPIYQAYCSDCHGERGPSPTRLDAREAWMRLSDRVIENIDSGRMPLGRPRMPSSDIALVQAWASGGFAE